MVTIIFTHAIGAHLMGIANGDLFYLGSNELDTHRYPDRYLAANTLKPELAANT